jgi:hypothetical protein
MLDDDPLDVPQLVAGKPVIKSHLYRLQPELCFAFIPSHMNVNGLVAIETVEKEAVGAFA